MAWARGLPGSAASPATTLAASRASTMRRIRWLGWGATATATTNPANTDIFPAHTPADTATATTMPTNPANTTIVATTTTPTDATTIAATTIAATTTVTFAAADTPTAAIAMTAITDIINEENPFVESLAYDLLEPLEAHLCTLSFHSSSDSQDISTETAPACPKTRKEALDVKTFFLRENAQSYCKYCEWVSHLVLAWFIF